MEKEKTGQRYKALDSFRGLVLVSMIIYHALWDMVYLFGADFDWYMGRGAYVWQQSICYSFILLSGFCFSLGKKALKRGLFVFGAGALISLATLLFMPEERVVFGVLTLLGSCMLLTFFSEKALRKIPEGAGLIFSILLFVITRNLNAGYLGFESWQLLKVPQTLYTGQSMTIQGHFLTFLGFTQKGFYSTDYFSLFPWLFLFLSGYFIYRMMKRRDGLMDNCLMTDIKGLSFLGRNSLLIYLLHQPVLYAFLSVVNEAVF